MEGNIVVLLLALTFVSAEAQELLKNIGFEDGSNHWERCWGFHCDIGTDSHSGGHAIKATGRTHYYQGPAQLLALGQGKRYSVEGWVKLLKNNTRIGQYMAIEVSQILTGGTNKYMSAARKSFLGPDDGWVHLTGDFTTVQTGLTGARVHLQGPDPGIDFLADDMSVREIPEMANWKSEANKRIENIRKSNIHFRITSDNGISPSSVQLEINQTKNGFPFGSAVAANAIASSSTSEKKYQQFIYDNFNWVVVENALKWDLFERHKGQPNYNWGEIAVKELVKHGINVRAHNMLWAVDRHVPAWLKIMAPDEVRTEVAKHIRDTATRYKGLVKHWDVNNELLHGNWYETKLQDKSYTKEVFRQLHQADPDVKLFLNDYSVFGGGASTTAYAQQGADYKHSNTHIYGMGIQSHFPRDIAPDPTLVKKRLDNLAQAGLPLWATELTVETDNEHQRADWLENAFRTLFSHPSVEGILLWGFWSEHMHAGERASLISGPEFRVNVAGQRFLHLIKEEWRTNTTHALSTGNNFSLRGFHGDYEVKVKVNGHIVQTEHFTLGKSDQTVNIHVHH